MALFKKTVYCVHERPTSAPLALGNVVSYCLAHGGGILTQYYNFDPKLHSSTRTLLREIGRKGPGIVLFSNYVWNHPDMMAVSQQIKQASPESITIHGGPSIPKYDYACKEFMQRHAHVDIAVRGEGEQTLAELLERLGHWVPRTDWGTALGTVSGITFCPSEEDRTFVVRTNDRPTITDLDTIPSPYTTGLFDASGDTNWIFAILETNRGCPYGCTFCDWGSYTLQKIRRFSMDRIHGEISWIGQSHIEALFIADANFGILPRDVDVAEAIVEAKRTHGYPKLLALNYAKNATRRVADIVRIFNQAGIAAEGVIALQTTDAHTLESIHRANIKPDRYYELLDIFKKENMPVSTDLLIGLPGATFDTFKRDLQFCFDRRVHAKAYANTVLPNAPMAHRDYMDAYGIETDAAGFVVSTKSASQQDILRMHRFYDNYLVFVEFCLLKYLLHFIQREHGIKATDVLQALMNDLDSKHSSLTYVQKVRAAFGFQDSARMGLVTYRPWTLFLSWDRFYYEIGKYFCEKYAIPEDTTLQTVLTAQSALMPRFGRRLPAMVPLEHDIVAYFRENGDDPRPLADYPHGSLQISDPLKMCWLPLMFPLHLDHHKVHFELESPLMGELSLDRFAFLPEERKPIHVVTMLIPRYFKGVLRIIRNAADGHRSILGTRN